MNETASDNPKSADVVARLNALYNLEAEDPDTDKQGDSKVENDIVSVEEDSEKTKEEQEMLSSESQVLAERYKAEFRYEQDLLAAQNSNKRQLVQLSESPLIFTIDEFIDPEACRRVQNDASGCFDLMYPENVSDDLFNGQESEMDGLLFNLASSLDHAASEGPYPDGLHMDTNNQCLNRHVTCILYLNDVPDECGGATVFPLARTLPSDSVVEASRRLLADKISHTRQKMNQQLKADAQLLEERLPQTDFLDNPDTSTAIRIQPKAGRLLVFFSRDSNGHEDPRTWHAGEKIKPDDNNQVIEKRILTLFKEVHSDDADKVRSKECSLEAYVAPMVDKQRKWLQAKSRLQRAILGVSSDDHTSS